MHAWSKYQTEIFNFIEQKDENLVIQATAGSGKTTTIVQAIQHLPRNHRILFLAFNKHIASALRYKMPPNCTASTFNAFGWKVCKTFNQATICEPVKNDIILRSVVNPDFDPKKYWKLRSPILRLVSVLKAYNYDGTWDWRDVLEPCGIDLPDFEPADKFEETLAKIFNISVKETSIMDFDDQIYQVVKRNYPLPVYDEVFVDEAQDLNPIQIEILRRMDSRIIAVGDTYQAIYGFRGADSQAMPNIITTLNAKTLPLSVCYRCPEAVIQEAQKICDSIESFPGNKLGNVDHIETHEFIKNVSDGNYVLCRTTEPLVRRCLQLIRAGRRATVKGREIGETLITMIEKVNGSDLINEVIGIRDKGIFPAEPTFPAFSDKLRAYRSMQLARLEQAGKDQQMILLNDQVDTILAIGEECDHTGEVIIKIENIFSDSVDDGVIFSTIHKAKGLEAQVIYILRPDLLPHPMAKSDKQKIQERNLKFVAITRSQDKLYWITPEKGEK